MADWQWGDNKKAVALTEEDIKAVIGRIVEAVTKDRASDLMEQYRQFVNASSDLTRAREDLARKDQEIFNLQTRIATLNGLIASLSNGVQYPIPTTQALPSFQDRYAASAPVPPLAFPGEVWTQTGPNSGHVTATTPAGE